MLSIPKPVNRIERAHATMLKRPSQISRTRRNAWPKNGASAATAVHTPQRLPHLQQTQQAFEEMFVASRRMFLRRADAILRNKEDAEDAVQNAFMSAFLKLHRFQGRSALSTWFTRVVINAALMIRRSREPAWLASLPEPKSQADLHWTETLLSSQPDPETLCAERERAQQIQAALQTMTPILRQAFDLVYHQELSIREACARLNVGIPAFKARLFRARQELFQALCRSGVVLLDQPEPSRLLVVSSHRATRDLNARACDCWQELACNERIA